jgi:hypothetical protein
MGQMMMAATSGRDVCDHFCDDECAKCYLRDMDLSLALAGSQRDCPSQAVLIRLVLLYFYTCFPTPYCTAKDYENYDVVLSHPLNFALYIKPVFQASSSTQTHTPARSVYPDIHDTACLDPNDAARRRPVEPMGK